MPRPRIHFIAPAGPCQSFMRALAVETPDQFLELVQTAVGQKYDVTANSALLVSEEDELNGGRSDDRDRAADIENALASNEVVAMIALRGGAWFTRILPLIDFTVLDRRTRPVALFGFSELTTLVNIVGSHRYGIGVYDMGPAFLTYGLRRYAARQREKALPTELPPEDWAKRQLSSHVESFFQRIAATLDGRQPPTTISARLVRGSPLRQETATFVGGNLTVFSTLVGSRYESKIAPRGHWIALEDFNDKPERFDRFLAHLTLAGYWEQCEGVLLGDFHQDDRDLGPAVLAMLNHHLCLHPKTPVLVTDQVGHTWPMAPLPLYRPLQIRYVGSHEYEITWPASLLRVV